MGIWTFKSEAILEKKWNCVIHFSKWYWRIHWDLHITGKEERTTRTITSEYLKEVPSWTPTFLQRGSWLKLPQVRNQFNSASPTIHHNHLICVWPQKNAFTVWSGSAFSRKSNIRLPGSQMPLNEQHFRQISNATEVSAKRIFRIPF